MRITIMALLTLLLGASIYAVELKSTQSPTNSRLLKLLHDETLGQPVDRREALAGSSDAVAADHWHVGDVQVNGQWYDFAGISQLAPPKSWDDYIAMRSAMELTEQRHYVLARWCKAHKLDPQAEAHWYGVLLTSPNNLDARRALGHAWLGDRWYSREELYKADQAAATLQREWHQWMPVMRKLVVEISSRNSKAKAEALQRLAAIQDPAALSSLEITALQVDSDLAIPFIRAIAKQPSKSACCALTHIALSFPADARGNQAIAALKSYPLEMYVPEILATLSTPIQTDARYAFSPKGELLIRRAMFREVEDEKQILQLNRLVRTTDTIPANFDIFISIRRHQFKLIPKGSYGHRSKKTINLDFNDTREDEFAAAKNAAEDQRELENAIQAANHESARQAGAAYSVLERTTGQALASTPEAWWDWWRAYNERASLGKSTRAYQYSQVDRASISVVGGQVNVYQLSCLAAGTLVHTSAGPKPIEKISVGDLVISQDVESGELALKPVLQTTVRPPKRAMNICTDAEIIQATPGHRWFVAGKGWLMTRELEKGMLLHTATGVAKIVEVAPDLIEQPTYNLIVQDFHTYFVGPNCILSFDNADPLPTMRAVPGYGMIKLN